MKSLFFVYLFVSFIFHRDGVKTYYADKEYASESDVEVLRDSQSQDLEDHSHVHFSLDTSYKNKCEVSIFSLSINLN